MISPSAPGLEKIDAPQVCLPGHLLRCAEERSARTRLLPRRIILSISSEIMIAICSKNVSIPPRRPFRAGFPSGPVRCTDGAQIRRTARSVRKCYKHRTARECILPKARGTGTGRRPVQSAMASTMSAELGPGESPGCCSGSPARSCCGSPTGRCGARCSSRRRGSPGSRLEAAHRQGVYHTPAKTPRRQSRRSRERDQSGGPLLERRLIDLSGQEGTFESSELPPEPDALDDPFKQVVGPPHPCRCLPGPTGCGGPPASARHTSRSARPRRPRPFPARPWSWPAPAPSS